MRKCQLEIVCFVENKHNEDIDMLGDNNYKLWRRDAKRKVEGGVKTVMNNSISVMDRNGRRNG